MRGALTVSLTVAGFALALKATQSPFLGRPLVESPGLLSVKFTELRDSPASSERVESSLAAAAARYDDGLFAHAVESLSALSSDFFTALDHPAYPKHSVRVKKSKFCDGQVDAYTGYIDVEARHLFFYFFESRGDPEKDDVVLWTNGGPGCSSAVGLYMELGPCRIKDENGTHYNPYAWNEKANVFFIDQPVGVGFSYADHGEFVSTTEEAAIDIAAFVFVFFEHFSQFKGRPFHLSGESYGGRYLPVFASAVYDLNPRLVKSGYTPINLTSVLIGNGYTEPETMFASYYDMGCTDHSAGPVLDISTCVRMKMAVPRCTAALRESCLDKFDYLGCLAASSFCTTELNDPFDLTGLNMYDQTSKCEGDIEDTLCYPVTKHIRNFLSRNSTRQLLGVDPQTPQNFSSCSDAVAGQFGLAIDGERAETQIHVANLLERGVRVLVYVGENDFICNWFGNARWTEALDWSGGDAYRRVEMGQWSIGGDDVGMYKASGGLTFATIRGAGHMVPYDKPKEALEMFKRWIDGGLL